MGAKKVVLFDRVPCNKNKNYGYAVGYEADEK